MKPGKPSWCWRSHSGARLRLKLYLQGERELSLEVKFRRDLQDARIVCSIDDSKVTRIDAAKSGRTLRFKLSVIENIESLKTEVNQLRFREAYVLL